MKKINNKFMIVLTGILFLVGQIQAQNTCSTAVLMDEYQYEGQQMMPEFSTVGVANDNSITNPPFCNTSVGTGGQKWFRLSLPNSVPIQVTLSTDNPSTNFDTKIHVYSGSCGFLTCVAGDDDSGTGSTSLVTFTAQPNTQYRIRVGGYNAVEGTTYLTMWAGLPGCTDPSAQNYDALADWENGTCCYNNYAILTLYGNGNQPASNSATLQVDGVSLFAVGLNQSKGYCAWQSCDVSIIFNDTDLGTWGGSTYSLTIDGHYFSGSIPTATDGTFSTVHIGICGCTDPLAGNYTNAMYDDGSCCYNVSMTLSADNPPGCLLQFYSEGVWPPFEVLPGETVNFCVQEICGNTIAFHIPYGSTTSGTYTLNFYGETITDSAPSQYQVIPVDLQACGCTNPSALNYEEEATLDDEGCYFDANVMCENAIELSPYAVTNVSTYDVPMGVDVPNCNFSNSQRVLWYKINYAGGAIRISTLGNANTALGITADCGEQCILL
jgi:hypothetical protein